MTPKPRPLADIKPYENNPRVISQDGIEKTAASIARFGWQSPIVVDAKGVIIIGHCRHLAAQKLAADDITIPDWKDNKTAPVVVADLPPEKCRELRLADNRTGEINRWDTTLLAGELADLPDLAALLFDGKEERAENPPAPITVTLDEPAEFGYIVIKCRVADFPEVEKLLDDKHISAWWASAQ